MLPLSIAIFTVSTLLVAFGNRAPQAKPVRTRKG